MHRRHRDPCRGPRRHTGVRLSLRQNCRLLVFLGAIGAVVALAGCQQPPAIGADVAVRIHGEEVRYDQFEAYLRDNVDGADASLESAVQSRLFDQFLDEQLLTRLAVERGMVEPDVDHRDAVAFLLEGTPREDWPDSRLRAYYEAHRSEYRRPEEVHLRQILVTERETAEEARQAIEAGGDFGEVAARFSQEPNAQLGGDQGRLAREDLPVAYVDAIFALAPGEVTGVIAADYGFHLFQVVERYPAEVLPFEEVAGAIRAVLERQRVDEIVAGFIQEARDRYNVTIFPSNIPFEYQGEYEQPNTPGGSDHG